jgi:hypothetical protein
MHRVRGGVGRGARSHQSELLVRMPKPRTLARRKTVVLNASDSGHLRVERLLTSIDETVTRTVTVTFKRL